MKRLQLLFAALFIIALSISTSCAEDIEEHEAEIDAEGAVGTECLDCSELVQQAVERATTPLERQVAKLKSSLVAAQDETEKQLDKQRAVLVREHQVDLAAKVAEAKKQVEAQMAQLHEEHRQSIQQDFDKILSEKTTEIKDLTMQHEKIQKDLEVMIKKARVLEDDLHGHKKLHREVSDRAIHLETKLGESHRDLKGLHERAVKTYVNFTLIGEDISRAAKYSYRKAVNGVDNAVHTGWPFFASQMARILEAGNKLISIVLSSCAKIAVDPRWDTVTDLYHEHLGPAVEDVSIASQAVYNKYLKEHMDVYIWPVLEPVLEVSQEAYEVLSDSAASLLEKGASQLLTSLGSLDNKRTKKSQVHEWALDLLLWTSKNANLIVDVVLKFFMGFILWSIISRVLFGNRKKSRASRLKKRLRKVKGGRAKEKSQ